MISLGLTGYPLGHSLSPRLHAAAFQAVGLAGEYRLYPVSPEEPDGLKHLLARLRAGELHGLNVTIPHKQAVLPLLDELSPSARAIGAVNTISCENGRLIGHNTDSPGFLADLQRSFPAGFVNHKAIVLGAGGAARAVVHALLSDGWEIVLAVRQADLAQGNGLLDSLNPRKESRATVTLLQAQEMEELLPRTRLVVNATPVGMQPEVGVSPWPGGLPLPRWAAFYDLVYAPRLTKLLKKAQEAGLRTASGIGMLVEQAALAFEIWTGRKPPRECMFAEVEEK